MCGAGLDVFRLGTVIGGTFVMGTRADTLYQAIEELAGEQGSINIVNKVEAAVSTSKVALALNSVRKALQARPTLRTDPAQSTTAAQGVHGAPHVHTLRTH